MTIRRKIKLCSSLLLLCSFLLTPGKAAADTKVLITTNFGEITVKLDTEKAPITVANFLRYVNDGFYEQTIFHRVIAGFMIQGGGFTGDYSEKETYEAIKNEGTNGLKNNRGTIAMARLDEANSATAQFYINVEKNKTLDYSALEGMNSAYTVFGKVTSGMKVVDTIATLATGGVGPFNSDVPLTPVIILSTRVIEE